jgi:hypothetical protein
MMTQKNWLTRLSLVLVLGCALSCGPLLAAGSFYDTIQGAGDDAQAALDDKPAPATAAPPAATEPQQGQVQ